MSKISRDDLECIAVKSKIEYGLKGSKGNRNLGQIMKSINGITCYKGDTRKLSYKETLEYLKDERNIDWKKTRMMRENSAAEYFIENSYKWDSLKKVIVLNRGSLRLRKYWENHLKWKNNYFFRSRADS